MDLRDDEGQEGGETSLDLRHYWNVIKKRRWIIFTTMAVVTALAVVTTMRKPKVYRATATVIVDPTAPNALGNSNAVVQLGSGGAWINDEYYSTQLDIINSTALARKVVLASKGLLENPRLRPANAANLTEDELLDAVANAVRARVAAKVRKGSRVFEISAADTDPKLAWELANQVARTYRIQNVEVKRDITGEARGFVAEKLDFAKAELEKSETELVKFKKDNDILAVSLDDKKNGVTAALEKFSASLTETQQKRYELQARRKAIALLLESEAINAPSSLLTDATTLIALRTTWLEEQRKLVALSERYGPKHPEVVEQQARVTATLTDLKKEAQSVLASIDAEIKALKDLEASYKGEVERLTSEAMALASKEREYKDLNRAATAAETNYMQLTDRLRDSRLQEQDTSNNIQPLDEAHLPTAPFAPNVRMAGIVGLGLGLLLAFGLAFLVEFLDRSVKSQEDIEQIIGLPFLGMVPSFEIGPADRDKKLELSIARQPNSTIAECCRVVRTNILFSSPDRPLKTLVVTSSNPVEGKTMNVVNLGIVMAQSGHRTLVVDTDMRRPRLHKALGVSNENGVSRLVVGETDLESSVKSTEVPNLFILPCGPIPPNPAELLQAEKFGALAKMLSERFDRVIFDSPPILAVTDAAVLSRVADGTIMVVRAGRTSRDAVIRSKRAMAKVNPNIVGVVLNDVDLKNPHYASYYHYYQYQSHEPQPVVETGKSG
jgi:polysaccharide biosynthesis transport protein